MGLRPASAPLRSASRLENLQEVLARVHRAPSRRRSITADAGAGCYVRSVPSFRPSLWVSLALAVLGACDDLGEFRAVGDQVFRGRVVGQDETDCVAGEPCSFIRRGFVEGTTAELEFDPARADSAPGSLTTLDETCGPTFAATPLQPIPALFHDQLSLYDFPGEARLQNYIFALRPVTGPLAGRDALAFVSLLRNGDVELRVLSGAGRQDCSRDADCSRYLAGECDYFGVFRLKRTAR